MKHATKTVPQILRENLCTLFNFLNLLIAAALAAVGAWKNLLFIAIILLNTAIGIVQELRAKRQIERLTLLAQPTVTLLRGGKPVQARAEDIRKGDTLVLQAGDALCTDCTVTDGWLEVNEAVLTGEAEPVIRRAGDRLLSGSSVVSGRCTAEALCAAGDCFTSKMVDAVKRTPTGRSELLTSMQRVTKLTTLLIVPLGLLLFVQAVFLRHAPLDAAVVTTAAGLLGMLPKGLVLLISIGLAIGVVRLSKKNVLVRDLHALENLARCDVVCLDKTGTLTEGSLTVEAVYPDMDEAEFGRLMAAYLAGTTDNNATFRALQARFPDGAPYPVCSAVPFSSERKWSSVTLEDGRTFVLGAPERLCESIPDEARAAMAQGKRVLFAGLCRGSVQPGSVRLVAMLVLTDTLRANAAETISYLTRQGVCIKVISGDSAPAASAVAKQAGIPHADRAVDASALTDGELDEAAETCTVFGRVTPEQKRRLIAALQKQGHRVAMTGDGVNDLLAMRQADCSAAMGNGSDAAKQTAQLVLLGSDFSVLRDVISEGRRVIHNMTRSAGVFFIKTIYSVLLCLLCLLANREFPFLPIQITLIDAVIEAFPAFFLSLERDDRPVRGTFLGSAVRAALPNAAAIFLCAAAAFAAAPSLGISPAECDLLLYLTVGLISLAGVVKAGLPLTPLHGLLAALSAVGFFGAVFLFAPLLQLPALTAAGARLLLFLALPGTMVAAFLRIPQPKKQTVPARRETI